MTTLDRLRAWNQAGAITAGQYQTLAALVRKERVSVFVELSAALYIGVLSLVAGLGWTFRTYFAELGDPFVLTTLSLLFAGALAYCFRRAAPYSHDQVESPNLALDYVLYLGCLALSAELAYLAFRFDWARHYSDDGLLAAITVFALLAYRFDNRFVLSLALASLAGWFGLKLPAIGFTSPASLRLTAIVYGATVATAGAVLYGQAVKRHFLETYLHIAANAVFGAVVSGTGDAPHRAVYLLALAVLSASAIVLGVRFTRFAFVAYGTVYGYAGISYAVLPRLHSPTTALAYFVVTGTIVIISLAVLARRFGRGE
jgi:hypothetical protein